jgi:phospholipase C
MKVRARLSQPSSSSPLAIVLMLPVLLVLAGCTAGQTGSTTPPAPTVTVSASPASITAGSSSKLTVTATNATAVTVAGSDNSSYTLSATGGTQSVSPTATTKYTATATGKGGSATASTTVTVTAGTATAVTIVANPTSIPSGNSSTLTITTANATALSVTGSDGTTYTVPVAGGKQTVSPTVTTTYTAKATGASGSVSATAAVTVTAGTGASAVNHVIFMMQENHTFDNYFGMLNPYRATNKWNVGDDGNTYNVDGIDPQLNTVANINNVSNVNDQGVTYKLFKLASTCIDDATSGWLESYGDMNRYDFAESRTIKLDGFVHDAQGYATSCIASGHCSGDFTDATGQRVMGYYDEEYLNYYYYMASQFALSDRWFSPVSAKSTPNRLATLTGGTTQGLVFDPGADDHIGQRPINSIFQALDKAGVSWKVYYTDTAGQCLDPDDCPPEAQATGLYPATTLTYLTYFQKYLKLNPNHLACVAPTVASSAVGDTSNSFCIDPTHVAWLSQYYTDLTNGTLPAFSYIEAGYGQNDEHPGSFQPVLVGQAAIAKVINAFMGSTSYSDSVFFFAYDEGGGPYDHVPPMPGHSNDKTDPSMLPIPDIASISVNPDVDPAFWPCLPPVGTLATAHCDLKSDDPGAHSGDAAAEKGFAAQIGFRVPNFVVSPFAKRHYVSHIPMDHTAVLKFVEDRFIGNKVYLTKRDAAQPDLLDFFDFNTAPWATPPTPPIPVTDASLSKNTCTPSEMGP